jgi:HPt (histidine-containing phosphotransfer) domain-containing protein
VLPRFKQIAMVSGLSSSHNNKKRKSEMAAVNIAFEAPYPFNLVRPSTSRPIDLVHLARQTMGDKALEIEVLQMFARQARRCILELATNDAGTIEATAHRLKGAAQAVGAFSVSSAAEVLESDCNNAASIANVGAAVIEAENFILKLCR